NQQGFIFFQAEDGIRDGHVTGVQRVLFRSPGMVMTIEPGLYISADTSRIPEGFNQEVPAKYLGIGVRIEDDVLVTEKGARVLTEDRKSTRLNSSHVAISYAVFCLKKKIEHD